MKHAIFKSIFFLIFIGLLSFDVSSTGLQDYLQNNNTNLVAQSSPPTPNSENLDSTAIVIDKKLTQIIEMVVAGIVASALIISLLVLFLGRLTGNREKKAIKKLRIDAEKEKDHITSAATNVREQEKETTKLVNHMRNQASEQSANKAVAEKFGKQIIESSQAIKEQEKELAHVSENVSIRMDEIQSYWDTQLKETVATINKVQHGLDENLLKVDADLETMQDQKEISQELLRVFLEQHNEQRELVDKNTIVSEQVSKTLEATLKESNQLVETLKKHQESAERSLKQFTDELTHYEEQAYEQFDTSFQVADLARQELNANIEESRGHIETMRRHEEQSHTLNIQTQKNLEALDYSKIMKLSNTLDSTQDMFTDIRNRVDDAKNLLNELKDIETDIRQTSSNVEATTTHQNILKDAEGFIEEQQYDTADFDETVGLDLKKELNENVYKIASGDNAPISFFSNIKDKES